jgi:predicted PurR-regulated permease PerM
MHGFTKALALEIAGVIGISLLKAVLGGIGMSLAGVPGTSLLTLAVLVLGIIQIGPLIIVAPLVVWSWTTIATGPALAFTACMATVSFMDSFLKPFRPGARADDPDAGDFYRRPRRHSRLPRLLHGLVRVAR